MLVLGVFIPIVQATTGAANDVRKRVIVDVYMKTDATQADVDRVRELLLGTPNVKHVEFVSKEQALRAAAPEATRRRIELLGSNPLPDTFRDHARRTRTTC